MPRRAAFVLAALAACAPAALGGGPATGEQVAAKELTSRPQLANRCVEIALGKRTIAAAFDGYVARAGAASVFDLKPTGIGTYLLQDEARLMAVGETAVTRTEAAGPAAEWRIRRAGRARFTIASATDGRAISVEPDTGELLLGDAGSASRLEFLRARGCTRYPEAQVRARGRPRPTPRHAPLKGFADLHLHITANMRAGGNVIYGEPFDRFGITEALGQDADAHGPDGSLDVTGNLLRTGEPTGTHDTHGWPTFAGWPVNDTYTHQQTYYMWLKRVWKAGMRLVVAQTVEDEPLCEIEPLRTHSCDEMETIKAEIAQLRALQDYVDAQSGGRGRGWLRIVTNPWQARRVIARGRLAVVIGMEASNPFGCSELQGEPQCDRADIDRGLSELRRLGLRSMFVTHWVDNAFGGAAFETGAKGEFISSFEVAQTGHPFATEPCGDADEAEGDCNAKGLTDLGEYLVRRMIDQHMLIEADHLSQKARKAVFEIADSEGYPLVSSHTGTGGEWTGAQLERLYRLGGIGTVRPGTAPEMVDQLRRLRRETGSSRAAIALGTDTGGFSALPGSRDDAASRPLRYPFTSYLGQIKFRRQRTGERVYDLNRDGVAHYGLFADLVADTQRQQGGKRALRPFFASAEAYLDAWRRAYRR